jgi:phosphoribosyl 1,2-cyclic phosphodiesterase
VLASGSSGNATFIGTERTRILIDAGLSRKALCERLALIGEDPARIDAVLITHEHSDHIGGLVRFARSFPSTIFMTGLTAPTVDWQGTAPRLATFQAGSELRIGEFDIASFTIPHDAVDPVGFCFRVEGLKAGIVTDLGYIPDSIKFHLRGADLLLLESNHDLEMLKAGSYPWQVKQRVMSRKGHLSNDVVSEFIRSDLDSRTGTLILGHLSQNNNYPALVELIGTQALGQRGHKARLVVAEPGRQSEVFVF